jgi:hypothetical protein
MYAIPERNDQFALGVVIYECVSLHTLLNIVLSDPFNWPAMQGA